MLVATDDLLVQLGVVVLPAINVTAVCLGAMLSRSMSMLVPRASMAPVNSESYLTFIGSRTSRSGVPDGVDAFYVLKLHRLQ